MAERRKASGPGGALVPPGPSASERETIDALVANLSGLNVDQLRLHGSVFAFSSIVGGIFFSATGSVFLAVVASLGTGIAAGIVNGLFISRLKVP